MDIFAGELGIEIKIEQFQLFFGNKKASQDLIEAKFPEYQFLRVKQVHGARVIAASSDIAEADAHYTDKKSKALIIATADCVPILIYDKKSSMVASIHAGWKGLALKILSETMIELKKNGVDIKNCFFYIGPHIAQDSFETGDEVKNQLIKTVTQIGDLTELYYSKKVDGVEKYFISLKSILMNQIIEMGGTLSNIRTSEIDTKLNLAWHSFRRDKAGSGRNLSFIAIRPFL
jgi:hypothetical protein